jgi:hypothetical protein
VKKSSSYSDAYSFVFFFDYLAYDFLFSSFLPYCFLPYGFLPYGFLPSFFALGFSFDFSTILDYLLNPVF